MTFFYYVRGTNLMFRSFWSSCMSLASPADYISIQGSLSYILVELETVLRRVSSKILIFLNAASPSNTLVFLSVLIGSLLASFPLSCMNLNLLYKAGWAINYPMLYKFSLAWCNFGSTFSPCPILSSTKLHAFARTSYGLVT